MAKKKEPQDETCYRDGCETRVFRRGLCEDHYGEQEADWAAEDAADAWI